ncbi:MAG: hypothetical protein AB1458_09995 [Bacteroidota bacterium]
MKKILPAILLLTFAFAQAQKPSKKKIQEIKDEGVALYTLEHANEVSLDVFYENEYEKKGIKGYFSYKHGDSIKTVFYAKIDTTTLTYKQYPDSVKNIFRSDSLNLIVVLKTFYYLKSITAKSVKIVEASRKPTEYERLLFEVRLRAWKEFNSDPLNYIKYDGTTMSMSLIDYGKTIKAFIITLPNQPGSVTFGNDYLFVFDKKTKTFTEKKKLHPKLIPISPEYQGDKKAAIKSSFHNHKGETDHFITSTDICILMLFKGGVEWEQHYVYSDKWVSVYTLYNGNLTIVDAKEFKKNTAPKEPDPNEVNPDKGED